jgi:LmbE family N-acetylglucosaminyl deacetylase
MSEDQNILDMADSDFEYLEPQEAQGKIDKVMREARANPQHPYVNKADPDHGRTVQAMTRLFEASRPPTDPDDLELDPSGEPYREQPSPEMQARAAEMMQDKAERQSALFTEGQTEMDALVELGYERTDVPDDISEHQVRGLKEQRLYATGDYQQLRQMLIEDCRKLGDHETAQLLQTFQPTQVLNEEFLKETFEKIIWKIQDKNKEKYGGQR